jgi:hypothetical protein
MKNIPQGQKTEFDQLKQRIEELETRLSRLEEESDTLGFRGMMMSKRAHQESSRSDPESNSAREESIESRIGEYGMAWLGNIVLLFGIIFLSQFMQRNNRELLSLLPGLASVAVVYLIGYYTRKPFPYMSRLFVYNGHLLLFYQAMRLHFFPNYQIIENPVLGYGLVVLVLLSLIYLAYRNSSQVLAVIAWLMALVTAIASGHTHFMLPLMVGIALNSVYFVIRKGWWTALVISNVLVYFTFLVWIFGDPFLTRSMALIPDHQFGHIYLFFCAIIYSLLAVIPALKDAPEHLMRNAIVLNGLGFSFIFGLMAPALFARDYYIYFGLIAAFCLGYSIWLQSRGHWKVIAALYAIYSFVTLSITIAGIYRFPLAFFLLSIQSLLVVSMALWFRSRFIVIMNTFLFIILLVSYLIIADSIDSINFSFAIVALMTARILNWKKKRLEIRTELIRNTYLFAGFLMVLLGLHDAVPPHFVTLSWALSALMFFIISVIINNKKYRWLAIITMVITVFYLFIVDLSNISLGYRILALLFISVVSLGFSIFYSRRQKQSLDKQE